MAKSDKQEPISGNDQDPTSQSLGSGYIVVAGADGQDQCVRESDGEVVDMSYCTGGGTTGPGPKKT